MKNEPTEKPRMVNPFRTVRMMMYFLGWVLIGCFAIAAIGLVGQQMQHFGNLYRKYPSMEYQHVTGVILTVGIISLLAVIGHAFASPLFIAFVTMIIAVMWGVSAGLLYQTTPFRGQLCGATMPEMHFGPIWAPYASQCGVITAMQAVSWANFFLTTLMLFYILSDQLHITVHGRAFYPEITQEEIKENDKKALIKADKDKKKQKTKASNAQNV